MELCKATQDFNSQEYIEQTVSLQSVSAFQISEALNVFKCQTYNTLKLNLDSYPLMETLHHTRQKDVHNLSNQTSTSKILTSLPDFFIMSMPAAAGPKPVIDLPMTVCEM